MTLLYFQVQVIVNSAEHPQIRMTNIFCPAHWACINPMKEAKVKKKKEAAAKVTDQDI